MKHSLDRDKMHSELLTRGWYQERGGSWISPLSSTKEQIEQDWEDSILAAIVCVPEQEQNNDNGTNDTNSTVSI